MRHSDLWFKCITPFATATQPGCFLCVQCGQTSHYPENCIFRPSPSNQVTEVQLPTLMPEPQSAKTSTTLDAP